MFPTANFCTRLLPLWISVETLSPNHPNTLKSHRERRRYAKPMECGGLTPLSTRRPDDASRPARHAPPDATAQAPSAANPPATVGQPVRPTTERQSAPRISREEESEPEGERRRRRAGDGGSGPAAQSGVRPPHSKTIAFFRAAQSILRRGKISRFTVSAPVFPPHALTLSGAEHPAG